MHIHLDAKVDAKNSVPTLVIMDQSVDYLIILVD